MVSNKTVIIVLTIALILFVSSLVINMSVSNMQKISEDDSFPEENYVPDTEQGQVNIIINKPPHAP